LERSVACFPLAGLLFGAITLGLHAALTLMLPPLPAAALLVVALMLLSGGLHVDGLADTADGFFSSRKRERILEIMRDSRTGSMGVAAVAAVIAVKLAAVASLPPFSRGAAIFLMPLAGRCALIFGMTWLSYARPEGGLPSIFAASTRWHVVWAIAVLFGAGWIAAGWRGLTVGAVSIVASGLVSIWSRCKIGGFTGDTLGATCEIVEAIPALVLCSGAWSGAGR
jgi:adenosylcobinamide-GDP ribazoletransferase